MNSTSRLVLLLLCLLLSVAAWLGASSWIKSWKAGIESAQRQKLNAAWEAKIRAAGSEAAGKLQEERKFHDKQVENVIADRDRALGELRKRPTRAEQHSEARADPAAESAACTGAGLAREDAEFLAGEAADAALMQVDLLTAVSAYETCRETLRKVTSNEGDSHEGSSSPGVPGP